MAIFSLSDCPSAQTGTSPVSSHGEPLRGPRSHLGPPPRPRADPRGSRHRQPLLSRRLALPGRRLRERALTSALRASMSPVAAASSCFSSPTTPSSSSTSSASELLSGGHDAAPVQVPASRPGPPAAQALAGPKGGRVSKRKPRPSRRAHTTYITADAANFRRMVQEITGFPVPVPSAGVQAAAAARDPAPAAPSWPPAPACVLPTLDTSAFLLDRATTTVPVPEEKSSSGGAAPGVFAAAAPGVDDDPCSVLQELEAMACGAGFVSDCPTLESWGII